MQEARLINHEKHYALESGLEIILHLKNENIYKISIGKGASNIPWMGIPIKEFELLEKLIADNKPKNIPLVDHS